jgi:uncharacterized OB-fold protein
MNDIPDRFKFSDDDAIMMTECPECGELYEMDSYCSPCFRAKRRRELSEENNEILKDIAKSIDKLFGSIKDQA